MVCQSNLVGMSYDILVGLPVMNCNSTSNNTFHINEVLTVGSTWSVGSTIGVELASINVGYSYSQQLELGQAIDINLKPNETVFYFIYLSTNCSDTYKDKRAC